MMAVKCGRLVRARLMSRLMYDVGSVTPPLQFRVSRRLGR
jgi:hypothetical protein